MNDATQFLRSLELSRDDLLAFESLTERDVVFLSGSLVEGLGNQASDIDVFVIGDSLPNGNNVVQIEASSVSIHFHGKRRVDFEFWRADSLYAVAQRVNALRTGVDSAWFSVKELELAHRLRIGLPVTAEARFGELQRAFDYVKLADGLARRAVEAVDDILEDLSGMLDDGDLDVALLRSRELLDATCDVYNHTRGSTNSKPKWRTKVLARLEKDAFGTALEREYWELQFPPSDPRGDRASAVAHVERCIHHANRVIHALQA